MRKFLLFVILTLFGTAMVPARNVTEAEALVKAQEWQASYTAKAKGATTKAPQLVMRGEGNITPYYIYSYGEGQGFVVISGDDRTEAVLGYADSGTFNAAAMPEAMSWWLEGYADQIARLGKATSRPLTETTSYAAIEPLVTTSWNQNEPYNLLCPIEAASDSERCVTGCVATAMAQALCYEAKAHGGITGWNEIPGYTFNFRLPDSTYVQKVDTMADHNVSWNLLRDDYIGNETLEDEGAAEVAALMAACGSSVKTYYHNNNLGGSSASLSQVPAALKKHFGFTGKTYYAYAQKYTVRGWSDLIYHELSQGRVVIYGGQTGTGGHAFLCDGYRDGDYFHFNWGWGGMGNGYFRLSVCNPDNQGIGGSAGGYSSNQEAVIGLSVNYSDTYRGELNTGTPDLTLVSLEKKGEHTLYSEMALTVSLRNNTSSDYHGTVIIEASGRSVGFAGLALAAGEQTEETFYYTPLATGTVPLRILEVDVRGYDVFNVTKVLAHDTIEIKPSAIDLSNDLSAALSVTTPNTGVWGTITGDTYSGYYTLTNKNTEEAIAGTAVVHLFEMHDMGGGHFSGSSISSYTVHVSVPADSSINVPFGLGTMKPDTYYMVSLYFLYGPMQHRFQGNTYKAAADPDGITVVERDEGSADEQRTAEHPAYNLQGQRVGADYRGIVIQNGRKRLQK